MRAKQREASVEDRDHRVRGPASGPRPGGAAATILDLQRSAGNGAVTSLLKGLRVQRLLTDDVPDLTLPIRPDVTEREGVGDADPRGLASMFNTPSTHPDLSSRGGVGDADLRGLERMLRTPAEMETRRRNRESNEAAHQRNSERRAARGDERNRVAGDGSLADKRAEHRRRLEEGKAGAAQVESDRVKARSAVENDLQAAQKVKVEEMRTLGKMWGVVDIEVWTSPEAMALRNALWEAVKPDTAKRAVEALVGHCAGRRSKVTSLMERLQSHKKIDFSSWRSAPLLTAASQSMVESDFTKTLQDWEEAIVTVDHLGKVMSEYLRIPRGGAGPAAGGIGELATLVADPAQSALSPVVLRDRALALWPAANSRVIEDLYNSKETPAGVTRLIELLVTGRLVKVLKTGEYNAQSDAKGAQSFREVGKSTEYAIVGLSNITVHVHWMANKIGESVASGKNPAHWKYKAQRRKTGVSTPIKPDLAKVIHQLSRS